MSGVIDLIESTVRIEQAQGNGLSVVGSGFVVLATAPDGAPRAMLVTAAHLFKNMGRDKVTLGFRDRDDQGVWRLKPASIRIRDAGGDPLWTSHPTQDIAAIEIPAEIAPAAVPAGELPGERALETLGVHPGDEMMVLGYPRGVAANAAGFPILRAGRVASFPLSPAERYPTYMLDFSVFAGNSGGPVYLVAPGQAANPSPRGAPVVVTGLLTQQIKLRGDRLAIGNVTQADFISETISLMDGSAPTESFPASGGVLTSSPQPASTPPQLSATDRLREAWHTTVEDVRVLTLRAWIVLRDAIVALLTPDAHRA